MKCEKILCLKRLMVFARTHRDTLWKMNKGSVFLMIKCLCSVEKVVNFMSWVTTNLIFLHIFIIIMPTFIKNPFLWRILHGKDVLAIMQCYEGNWSMMKWSRGVNAACVSRMKTRMNYKENDSTITWPWRTTGWEGGRQSQRDLFASFVL